MLNIFDKHIVLPLDGQINLVCRPLSLIITDFYFKEHTYQSFMQIAKFHKMHKITLFSFAVVGFLIAVSAVPLEKNKGTKRLIKTGETKPAVWLTEAEIQELIAKDQGFIDVTNVKEYTGGPLQAHNTRAIPTTLRYREVVTQAFQNISLARIESFIQTFSDFHNRYLNASTGVDSEKWLLSQVNASARGYPGRISVIEFEHPDWLQNSIIARIEGADPNLRSEVVILGAHQDSLNGQGETLRSPGADDNASGCITLLEALRAVVANGIVPNRTVEFHWYAAEERGLLGSREIAQSYRQAGVNVIGMINYDVVGYYVAGNDDVAIITDYVDSGLTQFLRILVDGYLDFGRRERDCGYACSDHAAWTENGYPSARPTQAVRNGQMHTVNDTIDTVSFVQVREFVKIAIGWLVELAEPANK